MKLLITGCGSIGQRHLKNLRSFFDGEIIAYRTSNKNTKELEEKYNIKSYFNLDEALKQKPDAVLITNPTALHIPVALAAAKKGCHLFIEKPISHTMEGVDELINIIKEDNLVAMVGYNTRFHPNMKRIKNLLNNNAIGKITSFRAQTGYYLSEWRPGDYRKSYSANKKLGGGVILDLSHEIDYARWFLGEVKEVFCFSDKLSSLDMNVEDSADILLKFKSGAIGNIHLDYIQRSPSRSFKIIGEEGTIICDLNKHVVKLFTTENRRWQVFSEDEYDKNEMYIEEMKHFINCIEKKEKPLIDIIDGKRTLMVALAAKRSAETGKRINLKIKNNLKI